jgi:gamma-glutamyl:cysteine ligase YbdK (ATP-grasp superfamily)
VVGCSSPPRFGTVEILVRSPEILAENRVAAARDGAHARLIDPVHETQVPATQALEPLLAAAEPHVRALHIDAAVDDARRLAADSGSERQRQATHGLTKPGLHAYLARAGCLRSAHLG